MFVASRCALRHSVNMLGERGCDQPGWERKLKMKMKMNWVISLECVLAVVSYSMWDEVLNVTDF